jgi:coiled-coil domain-containing protein 61
MLISALKRDATDELFVDLMTQYDLVLLKAKKGGKDLSQFPRPQGDEWTNQKRYLILTHVQEFEKVHFPMPLMHLAEPDVAVLRRTFSRMQS